MLVTLRTGSMLKKVMGGKLETEGEGATVGELFQNMGILEKVCKKDGKLRFYVNVHVNDGKDVSRRKGLNTRLKDGDVVTIITAIAGGSLTEKAFIKDRESDA